MKSFVTLSVAALAGALVAGCGHDTTTSKPGTNQNLTTVPPVQQPGPMNALSSGPGYTGARTQDAAYTPPSDGDAAFDSHTSKTKLTPSGGEPARGVKYTVKKGDTLWNIAQRAYGNGNQYKKIASANSIKGNQVNVGQVISIPE